MYPRRLFMFVINYNLIYKAHARRRERRRAREACGRGLRETSIGNGSKYLIQSLLLSLLFESQELSQNAPTLGEPKTPQMKELLASNRKALQRLPVWVDGSVCIPSLPPLFVIFACSFMIKVVTVTVFRRT